MVLTPQGMEGGEDEDLDYDMNEEFQDDEDNNTFVRNEEEEEEAKLLEERLRKEFKLANANVGDRPQIESGDESDDDDLFGEKLNGEGKRIKRMMKKRGERDDLFDDDSDEESDEEEVKEEKKEKPQEKPAPPSVERPSRPSSRGPGSRAATSPGPSRSGLTSPSKSGTAPPVSGAAFLAQRAATGGASPRRNRQGSPLSSSARGGSPDVASARGSSPSSAREGSPAPGTARPHNGGGPSKKRKSTSESPAPDGPNKRRTSPTGSAAGSDAGMSRKKKKSASATPTPRDIDPFPGMITREEVITWFKNNGKTLVPMSEVIQAFRSRLAVEKEKNQAIFLAHVGAAADKQPGKMLKLKEEFA